MQTLRVRVRSRLDSGDLAPTRDGSMILLTGGAGKWRNLAKANFSEFVGPNALGTWLDGYQRLDAVVHLRFGRARSFADLVRAIASAVGFPSRIEFIPMPEAIHPNYPYFTETRMQRLYGAGYDQAFTSIEDGVGRYVESYLAVSDRYR